MRKYLLIFMTLIAFPVCAFAGPYAPAAGQPGSTAVYMDSADFTGWATGYEDVIYGADVADTWKTPQKALGKAQGNAFDILCLGRGGKATFIFDPPIKNGEGWDFAVFENTFSDVFLELAWVEISTNGQDFIRFPNDSLTPLPVGAFGHIDPTDINGFGGKYRQGYGTPFDLQNLATDPLVLSGKVDLSNITRVRIIDVVGDGTARDSQGRVIYDPYPTKNSAGFDLDAIGARYHGQGGNANNPPDKPALLSPLDGAVNIEGAIILNSNAFSDPDIGDSQLLSQWQISSDADFNDLVLGKLITKNFQNFSVPELLLEHNKIYYFRVKYYDSHGAASAWSEAFSFGTGAGPADTNHDGVPDDIEALRDWNNDGTVDPDVLTVKAISQDGNVFMGLKKGNNIDKIISITSISLIDTPEINRPARLFSGLMGFKIKVINPDEFITVVIYLSVPCPPGSLWYKLDPVNGWQIYPHAVFSDNGKRVTLTLGDGNPGYGDSDGVKNGFIIDPGGPSHAVIMDIPEDGKEGLGSSGCFMGEIL